MRNAKQNRKVRGLFFAMTLLAREFPCGNRLVHDFVNTFI